MPLSFLQILHIFPKICDCFKRSSCKCGKQYSPTSGYIVSPNIKVNGLDGPIIVSQSDIIRDGNVIWDSAYYDMVVVNITE